MKKKVLLTLAAAMAVTSVAFASPLTNYDKGSLALDLNTSISPKAELTVDGMSESDDSKERLGAGISYGLGNKFALQYKFLDNKTQDYLLYEYSDPFNYDNLTFNAKLTGHELNVLYQINPNLSAYVGWTRSTLKATLTENYGPNPGNITESESISDKRSNNGYQVGLVGQTKLADKLTGWASLSAGNKVNAYEIGVGYDVAQNTELNFFYREVKYKDFNYDDTKLDVKAKGLGAGVTFKF
ncbi:outer membrane beta-barrel protein [Anaerospora hongkongensis]|uniref:outer membrane beta-barrel protein n=1 Tax=Anaerospora hongkongensis TaxID=244830 RepID=UPI00289ECFF9|nr:outer membrane beta-barrel protein [Anaerospora hongkongensis]